MNNKTVHNFTIKYRGDRVYDIYVDGKWVVSRGTYEAVLNDLYEIMDNIANDVPDALNNI